MAIQQVKKGFLFYQKGGYTPMEFFSLILIRTEHGEEKEVLELIPDDLRRRFFVWLKSIPPESFKPPYTYNLPTPSEEVIQEFQRLSEV
jgi:hypothetical protein